MNIFRTIIFVLTIQNFLFLYPQQPTIYGIPFGSSFSVVEKALDQKLFSKKYVEYDHSLLEYHDVNMAGITFGTLFLYFNNTGYENIMVKARLSSCYKSDKEQLKKDREILADKISIKYNYVRSYINDIGFKSYEFGFSKDYIVGELNVCVLRKDQSSFGSDYYYLELDYSPQYSDTSDL